MQPQLTRTHLMKLRLDDTEVKILNRVALEHSVDRVALLRMLLRSEYRRLFAAPSSADPSLDA